MNAVRWSRRSDGSLVAETTIAGCRVAGVMTPAELEAERAATFDDVGFRISLKALGRSLKKVASPGAVLKLARNTASVIDRIPGVKAALAATGPGGMAVLGGLAATKALAKAKKGDRRARAIVARAEQVAALSARERGALPMPTTREGHIVRYLVALQSLDR